MKKTKYFSIAVVLATIMTLFSLTVSAYCSHNSTTTVYSEENANEHSYYAVCDYCGESLYGWAYSGWSSHSFSGDTCTDCGYSRACTHGSTTTVYSEENDNEHSYHAECDYCGESLYGWAYSGWSSHSFSGDICTDCGYSRACTHGSTTTHYSFENDYEHSYYAVCDYCGESLDGWAYSGWSSHSYSGDTCTDCGFSRACSHSNSHSIFETYSDLQHKSAEECYSCGLIYNTTYDSHSWTYGSWSSVSATDHQRTKSCYCGESTTETEAHSFVGDKCKTCGYQNKPLVKASVTLSASGASGTLDSSGGEIVSETFPASYTVSATAVGCEVLYISYDVDDMQNISYGDSVTIMATSIGNFTSTTFTAYTNVPGVTATFTVNHKFVVKNSAYIMWETSHDAVIRSISGEGMYKSLNHSMTIPNSYDGQSNLTDEQVAEIQGLIGKADGKTYTVNYTRTINVYTPAQYTTTGQKQYHNSYDGGSESDIAECIATWGWTGGTVEAIRQAAQSTLTFTTGLPVNCNAVWINSATGAQIYSMKFGEGIVTSTNSAVVSVSYGDFADSGKYVFESLAYSGDFNGTSKINSFSQVYTITSKPLNVIFYCHPPIVDGDITVTAVDGDTGTVIPSATVSCGDKIGSSNPHTFEKLKLGTYSVAAVADGYTGASDSATITAEQSKISVTLKLYKQVGDITVNVCDSKTSKPISGASVSGTSVSGTTDSGGFVSFSNVPFGSYSFTATASGYYPNSASVSISRTNPSESVTIYLDPIPKTGDITVTVVDSSDGYFLWGAYVSGTVSGSTDSSGSVSFSDIPFGSYTFTASADGYYSNSGTAEISLSSMSDSITIPLDPIPTNGDITVYVLDKDSGDEIAGATVSSGGISKTTDSWGTATFFDLDFGSYSFTAIASGYDSASASTSISEYNPDTTVTIYLERQRTDLSVRTLCNGTVYKGSTIMVTAEVMNDGEVEFTPSKPVSVSFKAKRDGTVVDSQTKTVIIPSNEKNLTWFEVVIPDSSNELTFEVTVTPPSRVSETDTSNNRNILTKTATVLPERNCEDVGFELYRPNSFMNLRYNDVDCPTMSWSVFEWDGGFVRKTYSANLYMTAELFPNARAGYRVKNGSLWTTRSGYGVDTEVDVNVNSSSTAIVGELKVDSFYPEHNYSTALRVSDRLELNSSKYVFKVNPTSVNGERMHTVPLWFPDGSYAVKYYAFDVWCPAGMLTGYTNAKLNIAGDMYDDLYTS